MIHIYTLAVFARDNALFLFVDSVSIYSNYTSSSCFVKFKMVELRGTAPSA